MLPLLQRGAAMKAKACGFLAVVALIMLAIPMKALAHDHDDNHGWHHDHGHHYGWYRHHGGYSDGGYGYGYGGYPGYGRHDDDDDEHGGYGYGGYPGNMECDDDGDGCRAVPPVAVPWGTGGYWPMTYSRPAANAGKLIQLRQTISQRLNANQALYQAAMAQGNYPLAGKVAARMQNESATVNAANSMLNGAAAPAYPYNQSVYGGNPYYGQSGYSPLGAIVQMLGY